MAADQPVGRPVRIANCSGFYGDRIDAARLMVDGGPIDVLTGDYLAELTMLILWKARRRDPGAGYARTFLVQLEQVLGTCLDRGIRIVVNAGGLNPAGLAEQVTKVAAGLGLSPRVAHVTGDDLTDRIGPLRAAGESFTHLDTGRPFAELAASGVEPVTANAYLGGWGIAAALEAGADVVVTPRVTDASLVVGPAAWWHGWARTDWDRLAGAVAAGHVIECGPQACGGNYAFGSEVTDRRYPGFPIAEVAADGSSVITKHADTGGLVSVGTVTAQLLYEIAEPAYPNPDVVAHFDTVSLTQTGPHRVRISGTRGSPPPGTLKVAMNYLGGYRNTMTLVLTGLDIEAKAAWARHELFDLLGGENAFDAVDVRLLRFDHPDADDNALATAHLRITVKDRDPKRVGRAFSDATMALALGGYAGFHTTTPPTAESAYGVYWPTLVGRDAVEHRVVLDDGRGIAIPHSPTAPATPAPSARTSPVTPAPSAPLSPSALPAPSAPGGTVRIPLGLLVGARSGDKGGNANVGVWARDAATYTWLAAELTARRFAELVPEARGLQVRRYELANLRAVNFVVVGLLGEGVASATRPDPQAKGLAEYVRSRHVEVPVELVDPIHVPSRARDGALFVKRSSRWELGG
ncbi:acyclic terpene utilization AtuA family protein [Frankia gtarii]|uniref:acyclic terpene utilization AtuA family protein n=1 Tax=Frankia gtarii TaxID=2950102 RepID=UPI0021C0ABFA|nr:acyclic terpene utilization AtuA family protein [Frankia gtarii]